MTRPTRGSRNSTHAGVVLVAAMALGSIAACGSGDVPEAGAVTATVSSDNTAPGASRSDAGAGHQHGEAGASEAERIDVAALAPQLAAARLATAPYVTAPERAAADGYSLQITPMVEDMGVHYLNGSIEGFDPARPPILVYVPTADGPQLGAIEWVSPEEPAEPPFPGATYGEFPAACHYVDGNFVSAEDQVACAPTHPDTGAAFTFWHDPLATLHVWLWYHNPNGIYAGTNPLVNPFNDVAPEL